jgi:hypothetical protein
MIDPETGKERRAEETKYKAIRGAKEQPEEQ